MESESSTQATDLQLEYPEINDLINGYQPDRLNLEAIFADRKGMGIKRYNKKRIEYLQKAGPLLNKMLWEGEVIEDVARGVRVSTLEQFFAGGVWTRYINFTTMILTNFRLLLINTDSKGRPKDMLYHQIRFNAFKKISKGSFGFLKFKFADGKTMSFREVNGRDKKRLKERLEARIGEPTAAPVPGPIDQIPGCDNLCTTCYQPVPQGVYTCENCGTEFRTPEQAALRSLILPGLGDLYLRHHTLAVFEILGSLAVYSFLIISTIMEGNVAALIPVVIFIALINGLDAIVTYFIAKKGLIPLQKPSAAGM